MHVLWKVEKNIIFQNKTQNITSNVLQTYIKQFGTNFVISNIFLKAENNEDSLASSCAVLLVCHVW